MAFEVFDDVAFYYLCTSLLAMFVLPATFVKGVYIFSKMSEKKIKTATIDLKKYSAKGTKLEIKETYAQKYFTVSNVLFLCGWILLAYLLVMIPSYENAELLDFQPYTILDVEEGADEQALKKAYRKQSLQFHPDKNPGDKKAEEKFINIAKAYKALTDETTKENYQKYGNADGYQGTSVTIGLPSFLTEKDNELKILLVYFLIMIVIPPVLVFVWWQKAKDFHETGALTATVQIYYSYITEHMSARTLIEVLAASREFKVLQDVRPNQQEIDAALLKLSKIVQEDMKSQKKFEKIKYIQTANILLHAYLMREEIPPCLQDMLAIILKDCHRLLGVLFDVCVAKKHYKVAIAAVELMQLLSQAMWFGESPLLQLPHFTEKEIKLAKKNKIGELDQYKGASMETKKKVFKDWTEKQLEEIESVINNLPDMELQQTTEVEDEEDSEIFEEDTINILVKIVRKTSSTEGGNCRKLQLTAESVLDNIDLNDDAEDDEAQSKALSFAEMEEDEIDEIMEGQDEKEKALLNDLPIKKVAKHRKGDFGKEAYCPFFPYDKHEKWCLLLWQRDRKATRLLRITQIPAFQNETEVEMKMRMVDSGIYHYDVQARCDSYVGCDVACSIKVVVKKLNETEKSRREQNLEVSKDYGLDDEEEEEEVEEEGVWYFMYFPSFWEMLLNLVVLGILVAMGYEFLKSRGIWDKHIQPPVDFVFDKLSPVTSFWYSVWLPIQGVITPIVMPVWNVIVYAWDVFTTWVVPAEELNPNYKRNRDAGGHDDL